MPANNPRQPKRSWKDEKPLGGNPGPGQRGWHKEPTAAGPKGPLLTRRGKIALALAGLVVGVIAIVVVLYLMRTIEEPWIVVVRADYATNLAVPENVAGAHAAQQLENWGMDYNTKHRKPLVLRPEDFTHEGEDPFDAGLKGCNRSTVVLFVAVHGNAVANEPYLIPNDANPRNAAYTAHPLSKALAALGKLPTKTKKLLILDTTGVESDATLGQLHNDFTRALLQNKAELAKVPNLAVLVASDEDQRSWVSEEWGTSIFAHFVIEGLKGGASENGQVTAKSLHEWVRARVEEWARDNRGAPQTPLLIDDGNIAGDTKLALASASDYTPPAVADVPPFKAPKELLDAWTRRDDLQKSQPSPAAYTPQLWRQYLDSLKRYQDLLRANDPTSAGTMAATVEALAKRIEELQRIPRELANNLVAPAAFGWSLTPAEINTTQQEFTKLWAVPTTPPAEFGSLLRKWQEKDTDSPRRQLWRLRLSVLILQQAIQPEGDVARAFAVLADQGVNDPVAPRPAEAHLALMLDRYLPKENRNLPAVRKALAVCLQAEETALGFDSSTPLPAYSEQVYPWIRSESLAVDAPGVERADDSRQRGESLLFALTSQTANADAATEKAQVAYTGLQEKAAIVRRALAARDRAFVELPYYTDWLGSLPLTALTEDQEKPYLDLWDALHLLASKLNAPAYGKIDDLPKPTRQVEDGLNALERKFRASLEVRGDTQTSWHDLNNLLRVPFIEAGQRMDLLNQLRATGRTLNDKPPSGLQVVSKTQNSDDMKKIAQRRGRLALAALGKDHPTYEATSAVIAKPDDGAWGRSLAKAGDEIGGAYRKMAQDAYANTEKSYEAGLGEARTLLRKAASQARQLPGAAAAAWPAPALDPVNEYRRLALHDLLLYQTRRTFADYWADTSTLPYYRAAGTVYLAAATDLIGGNDPNLPAAAKAARLSEVKTLTEQLALPDALVPQYYDGPDLKSGSAVLSVTDEDRVPRRFRLKKPDSAPPGIAVVWTTVGKGMRPAKLEDEQRRALVRASGEIDDGDIEYDLLPDAPKAVTAAKEQSRQAFTGFFRGRQETLNTAVTIYRVPDVTPYQPDLPRTAHLAVTASEEDFAVFAAARSELVIVVDFSGSMGDPTADTAKLPKAQRLEKKYLALDGLKRCLAKVPKGVRVTVLTFSEQGGGTSINVQREAKPWDRRQSSALFERLEGLTPEGFTPLARATVKAGTYFTDAKGVAKTILVVTDGGDSEFSRKDDDNGKKLRKDWGTMEIYMKKNLDPSIQINVIGIDASTLDLDYERLGLEMYETSIKALGGEFVPVNDSAKLATQIERSLLQIRYRVEGKENNIDSGTVPADVVPEGGASVNGTEDNYRWISRLEPGSFLVTLQTNRKQAKAIEQRVRLQGGDAMALQLRPDAKTGQFVLRPEVWGYSHDIKGHQKLVAQQPFPPDADVPSWLVSVVQNQRANTGQAVQRLTLTTALEKLRPSDVEAKAETGLGLGRPPFVWFEVSAKGAAGKPAGGGRRFYPLADYPAPAYAVELPEWQRDQEPVLDVWWTQDAPPDCGVLRAENGKRLTDYQQEPLEVRTLNGGDATRIVVESIRHEKRNHVEYQPGKFRDDMDCAVVRLRWDPDAAKGKAFFALLPDGKATGWEQHIYLEAGKYTGVFFNVSAERLKALDYLTLYSVEGVKAQANKVPGMQLGVPNDRARPAPIVD